MSDVNVRRAHQNSKVSTHFNHAMCPRLSNTPVPCPVNDERGWARGYDFHKFVEYCLQIIAQIPILAMVNHHRAQFPHEDDFIAMKLLDISIIARMAR